MFNTLYLLNFNNYYNREFKKFDTIDEYVTENYFLYTIEKFNFNPNDHIQTEVIVNIPDNIEGNYLVVVDANNNIVSRWFVIESIRIRGAQYKLILYRDTIADYYDVVANSPCFIEKALVPESDSAIFNSEDMTFNRIKTEETPIMDDTQTSWLVAYIDKSSSLEAEVTELGSDEMIISNSWEWLTYANGYGDKPFYTNALNPSSLSLYLWDTKISSLARKFYSMKLTLNQENGSSSIKDSYVSKSAAGDYELQFGSPSSAASYTPTEFKAAFGSGYIEAIKNIPMAFGIEIETLSDYNRLKGLEGQKVRFEGGTESFIVKVHEEVKTLTKTVTAAQSGFAPTDDLLFNYLKDDLWEEMFDGASSSIYVKTLLEYSLTYTEVKIELQSIGVNGQTYSVNIPTAREHLKDAPYDMICAPYDTISIFLNPSESGSTSYQDAMLALFSGLAKDYGGGQAPKLYDVQRLPYCPIQSISGGAAYGIKAIDASNWKESTQAFPITAKQGSTTTTCGYIFACTESSFQKWIPLKNPITINNIKIQNHCDMYRICSPNYNGIFEFDPTMNNGLNGFNIYCTYKPYNPYIQVSPDFNNLYGRNFNDARGLICGGEWSMPIMTSAWETYERENANYLNIFNRSIENMKVQHKAQRTQESWSMLAGTLQGAATGAAGGAMVGGLYGGIAGAVGGGIASGAGAATDRRINEMLRNEAIAYSVDQFGYQLGNIQALPLSLARTNAFTVNNKIFPFLEYYSCTYAEKKALANKIVHNGMTVMRIGTIGEYINNSWSYDGLIARNYIKGQIIKCEGLLGDQHLANTISKEINQGIYFGGQK